MNPENKNDLQDILQIVFVVFLQFWALSDQLSQTQGDVEQLVAIVPEPGTCSQRKEAATAKHHENYDNDDEQGRFLLRRLFHGRVQRRNWGRRSHKTFSPLENYSLVSRKRMHKLQITNLFSHQIKWSGFILRLLISTGLSSRFARLQDSR
jgi:hypothetical protein